MKVNKAWLASIMVYFAMEIVKRYNLNLPSGWESEAYTGALFLIQYGAFGLAAFWDKFILHKVAPSIPAAPTVDYRNYEDLKPVLKEVHAAVNDLYNQVNTGKYTAATQEAIDTYLKLQSVIKKGA